MQTGVGGSGEVGHDLHKEFSWKDWETTCVHSYGRLVEMYRQLGILNLLLLLWHRFRGQERLLWRCLRKFADDRKV